MACTALQSGLYCTAQHCVLHDAALHYLSTRQLLIVHKLLLRSGSEVGAWELAALLGRVEEAVGANTDWMLDLAGKINMFSFN